jgi:hypothetical protein
MFVCVCVYVCMCVCVCHTIHIFLALLASQYPSGRDGEVLPRKSRDTPTSPSHYSPITPSSCTSELALLAALDRMLGVSSLMNCKSGCDRAGLVSCRRLQREYMRA